MRARIVRALESKLPYNGVVLKTHEVILEVEPPFIRSQSGAQPIIRRRQHAGTDAAQRRLTETQRLLENDWQQIRQAIMKERRDLAELESSLQARRAELDRQRQEARQAADKEQAAFDAQRRALAEEQSAIRARESELAKSREAWIVEKLEVEEIIRGLLVQLGQQAEADTTPAAPPG